MGARGGTVADIDDAVLSSPLPSYCSYSHFPAIFLVFILILFIVIIVIFYFIVN